MEISDSNPRKNIEISDDPDFAGASGKKRPFRELEVNDVKDDILGPNKVRYLLVSSGCAICLLELKQDPLSNVFYDLSPLPKIATLKLIEKSLPVSVGLFRFGSDPYVIGGHSFFVLENYNLYWNLKGNPNPPDCELYKQLLMFRPLEGTSRTTYRLSLLKDEDDGKTLSLSSECSNIKDLIRPKFWPALVEVNGQVHVFDSGPLGCTMPKAGWCFSHEVLTRDGWMEIDTTKPRLSRFIHRYMVLGPYIFAVAGLQCLLFDSTKMQWKESHRKSPPRGCGGDNLVAVKSVFDILSLSGLACKIGEIGVGDDMHYVILVLLCRNGHTPAIAYLVTSTTGQVVCTQPMPDIFSSVQGPIKPCYVLSGTVIKSDEGKTMCLILNAHAPAVGEPGGDFDMVRGAFLFIYTFKMKALISNVSKYLAKGLSVMQTKFVRIDIKDSFIFEANAEFDEIPGDFNSHFVDIQACFVDRSFVDGELHC